MSKIFRTVIVSLCLFIASISLLSETPVLLEYSAQGSYATAYGYPALNICDGSIGTVWSLNNDAEYGALDIQLDSTAYVSGIYFSGFLADQSLLQVNYYDEGWRPYLHAPVTQISSGGLFLELSRDRITTDRIQIVLSGSNAADSYLSEVELLGIPAEDFLHKITIEDISSSSVEYPEAYPAENLFDGNTRTAWWASRTNGIPAIIEQIVGRIMGWFDAINRYRHGLRDGDANRQYRQHQDRYDLVFSLADDAELSYVRFFIAPDASGQFSFEYAADDVWLPLIVFDAGVEDTGWKTIDLSGTGISTDALRLSTDQYASDAGGIGELEVWGCGCALPPVQSGLVGYTADGSGYQFSIDNESPLVLEVLAGNALNDTCSVEVNGYSVTTEAQPFNGDTFLFRWNLPSSILSTGTNYLQFPDNGDFSVFLMRIAAANQNGVLLIDSLPYGYVSVADSAAEQIFHLDNPALIDQVRLYAGGRNCTVSVLVADEWITLEESENNENLTIFVPASSLIVSDTLKIEGLEIGEKTAFQVIGSSITTGPPHIDVISPADGAILDLTDLNDHWIFGTVDDAASEVKINGRTVFRAGNYFWMNLLTLNLDSSEENVLTVTAVDDEGQSAACELTVYSNAIFQFSLDQEDEIIYTADPTVEISGRVVGFRRTLWVDGEEVETGLLGRFSTTVSVHEGFNLVSVIVKDHRDRETRKNVRIVYSANPLTINVKDPENGSSTFASTVRLSGTINVFDSVTLTVNDMAVEVHSGEFLSFPITLEEGSNTIHLHAVDAIGRDVYTNWTVFRDTVPPVVSILYPAEGGFVSSPNVQVRINAADSNTVWVFANSVLCDLYSNFYATVLSFPEGPASIEAEAVDAAGNRSATTVNFTTDYTPPEEFSLETDTSGWSNYYPTLTFCTTDAVSGIAGYELFIGDGKLFP